MNNIKIMIFLVLTFIMLPGANVFAQTAEEQYQKGLQFEEIKGDFNKAIEIYSSLIKKYPANKQTDAMAQLHIGICYEKLGKEKLAEAVAAFQKVISLYPGQKDAVLIAKQKLFMDTDGSAIQEIKNNLAEWNKAYESKDADKYCSFESIQFSNMMGGPEKAKEMVINNYFSKWKQLQINSTVKSIEKSGNNYVVNEAVIFTNTGWSNNTQSEDADRLITFTKENGVWKILSLQNQIMLAEYNKLNNNYSRKGEPGLVYVSHISHNFVSVIDSKTDSLIGKIPCGEGAAGVAFSSYSGNGYIVNYSSNDITVFNKNTNEFITTVPAGTHPSDILITSDGKSAFITHESEDGLWLMSTKENQIIFKVPGITGMPVNDTVVNKIFVSAIFTPYVYVFNGKAIETGGRPMDIAISPDGNFAYVANYDLNEVEKIDTRLDSLIERIPGIQGGRGIAVSPDNKYVYVTNVKSNTVTVIDLATDKVSGTLTVGKMPTTISMNNENQRAYVSNQGSASISVIDTKANKVIKTIHVTDNPIRVQVF